MRIMNYATRQVVTVRPRDSIDRAISLMEEHGFHHLVVEENGRVVGMVSDRDILISTGWMLSVERRVGEDRPTQTVGPTRIHQIMSHPVWSVTAQTSAREAAMQMLDHHIGALPVLQESHLVGILTETDLLKWLDLLCESDNAARRLLARPVSELMQVRVVTVVPRSPLAHVVDLFRKRHVRHVVVAVERAVLGVVSDRDVRRALGWASVQDQISDERHEIGTNEPRSVAEVMSGNVVTVGPETTLQDALRLMLRNNIHSLVVTRDDRLEGIITQTDFVKAIAREEVL